jgi:hypothetical protein
VLALIRFQTQEAARGCLVAYKVVFRFLNKIVVEIFASQLLVKKIIFRIHGCKN